MAYKLNKSFISKESEIKKIIESFNTSGEILSKGKRNIIKTVSFDAIILNIKSFKKPNIINKIVYRFFRKSKAQRSFEYAQILLDNQIKTPQPIAYFENFDLLGLSDSYYVCQHLNADLTYRELVETDYPDAENILRQFVHFTFSMHEKGIEFLDHSPGNTLIIDNKNGTYDFYLVDLNRMKFHSSMNFETRMKNLSKITPKKEMIALMSNEYAKLYNESEEKIFKTMWRLTQNFQSRFYRKKRIKKCLKFWKKL
ncbi:MAG TPA: Kdo domain containing protein [Flavobacterium sp.]|nr:Kdo domain containing protein [Flavobacterium sp.]